MRRREFLGLASLATAAWPFQSFAQHTARPPRIGILVPGSAEGPDASRAMLNAMIEGLEQLGYVEGKNVVFERRFGESNPGRLRQAAAELVEREVDVIVAQSTTAARPAKLATGQIPIVAIGMADPVEDGLVASLARPGGNLTGTTFFGPQLVGKRLQLLKEVVPQLTRAAVLWHPQAYGERTIAGMLKEIESAAQSLGVQIQLVTASSPVDIEGAFSDMVRQRAAALTVFPSPMLYAEYPRIVRLAAVSRLPAIYAAREGATAGGLMSYGANLPDLARQTAPYVQKILKGAKPADLPVQQPIKFELVVNLETAKSLGLAIDRNFLQLADEVIE